MTPWSTLVAPGQTTLTIPAGEEVLLDTQPGSVTTLYLEGTLCVREGYTLQGVQVHGNGLLRPETASAGDAVSARQIRLALNQLGMRDAVEAAVAASSRDVRDYWEYSTELSRSHPLIEQMLPAIGVTSDQADAVWALARTL